MSKPTPFLWFNGRVEEAVTFYTSVFPDSKVHRLDRYPDGSPGDLAGQVMLASFTLNGQDVMALNGGPTYELSPAFSFFVSCEDQDEVDKYWDALLEGGEPSQCGWLVDRFGVSWQIVPTALGRVMGDPDPERSGRVMQAMLGMVKLDVAGLQAAYDGS
jgi:predicted 3-demethylubiquinone-9 3-methyltransferase (glyoxalase superfamily)